MFCNGCALRLPGDSAFCSRCGKQLSAEEPGVPRRLASGSQQTIAGLIGSLAGGATRRLLRAGPKAWFAISVFLILLYAGSLLNNGTRQVRKVSSTPGQEQTKAAPVAPVNAPTIPPPKFRVYRSKLGQGTSVIVSSATSDEQLRRLLWLFREKVRSHRFPDVGITRPTSKQWGREGYLSGIISVYRGEKCADESFSDYRGPCTSTVEHQAAEYQWGLLVDGVFNTDADVATIYAPDRTPTEVFSYKDHWQLPAGVQADLAAQKSAEQAKATVEQLARKDYAEELHQRLRASGFDITVWARDENSQELALDSDIFKSTATRIEFLKSVLPRWRRDVCAAGFRQVRLIQGGVFSTGDAYSIGCK